MYIGLHVKYPLLVSHFIESFRKILEYKILWKSVKWEPSRPMQTEGRTDRQTDMAMLIVPFHNSANARKNTHCGDKCNSP